MTFELASKFGTPYYDNQLPAYRGAGKGISCYQCCAYQFSAVADKDSDFDRKLFFEDGRHFSMGSWQVVSVNCPRAAYNSEGDDARVRASSALSRCFFSCPAESCVRIRACPCATTG